MGEIREAAHKTMDAYLDAGGPSDFLIVSREELELSLGTTISAAIKAERERLLEELESRVVQAWDKKVIDRAAKINQPAPAYEAVPLHYIRGLLKSQAEKEKQ
jgi:hypothetical protein